MKEVRDRFYVEGTLTGYLDHGPNDSESPPEPITVKGADIWAAIEDHEKRVFNRELIPVVRFLCGPVIGPSPVWYWVPRREFDAAAKKANANDRTGTPFQR